MKLAVFYHLYIHPAEYQLFNQWPLWVDEQLGVIESSKLSQVADINICIVMPKYHHLEFIGRTYQDVVLEYINDRYPFARVIDIRDHSEPNIHEGQTLSHLYKYCANNDGAVLYMHSKGITRINVPTMHDWRRYLQHFMITCWQRCIQKIPEHDIVTVKSESLGNFWWANNNFIRKLSNPLYSSAYLPDKPHLWEGTPEYRYAFELWSLQNANICYVHDSGSVVHYKEFHSPKAYR